jgi:hypothetical protein
MTYSPMSYALMSLVLLGIVIFVESFGDKPTIGDALTLGASFIGFGAFVLTFINYFGTLP